MLTPEEMEKIEALGGLDALMQRLKELLAEQKGRHQGGSKWIGTAGTSPFGAHGYNPEGVRIGQEESRHRRAVKVWDKREYRDLDDTVELGTRGMKLALRRLRRFARQGAATELDIHDTIQSTANNAGMLDLKMVPERHNTVKVLLLLDVGGSMDDHVKLSQELFSAVRSEFKHLEYYYFHNFPYEKLWKNNRRRHEEVVPTWQVLRTYGPDYKLIIVGDGAMSPYEITMQGGSVEHYNEEAGMAWLERLCRALSAIGVAEPDTETELEPCAVDHHGERPDGGTDVPVDGPRDRRDDEGTQPVAAAAGSTGAVPAGASAEKSAVIATETSMPRKSPGLPVKLPFNGTACDGSRRSPPGSGCGR